MKIILAALVIFLVAMLGMALGVIFGRRCIRGSCGGASALRDSSGRPLCERCGSQPSERTPSPREDAEASKGSDGLIERHRAG